MGLPWPSVKTFSQETAVSFDFTLSFEISGNSLRLRGEKRLIWGKRPQQIKLGTPFFPPQKDQDIKVGGREESEMKTILSLIIATLMLIGLFSVIPPSSAQSAYDGSACIAHRPNYIKGIFEVYYSAGCTGHDEPELDPVSNLPGSARDLTWTVILPTDGSNFLVSQLGPTFWFGGTVTDPNSLFGQAFVELQFYADAIVTNCTPQGGFVLTFSKNSYSVCSPVWKVVPDGNSSNFKEVAAFNAMLVDSSTKDKPLVMHAGDEITVHWFTTQAKDGFHVTVTDLVTGHSGTIVLNSKHDGPLMPAFDKQEIGNALGWGVVDDTPNSFVWEIGHTSDFAKPPARLCFPGQTDCFSYDRRAWAGTMPIEIISVTFANNSTAKEWAVVSDLGGKAEVNQFCSSYGGPFCIYPWYTLGSSGFHYGVDYGDTIKDFGKANQFAQEPLCGGPFGPNTTYCDTMIIK